MKEQYSWDEIARASDFLEDYDTHFDEIMPCPPDDSKCDLKCTQCRMKYALSQLEENHE